jgi:hypothetical protein
VAIEMKRERTAHPTDIARDARHGASVQDKANTTRVRDLNLAHLVLGRMCVAPHAQTLSVLLYSFMRAKTTI